MDWPDRSNGWAPQKEDLSIPDVLTEDKREAGRPVKSAPLERSRRGGFGLRVGCEDRVADGVLGAGVRDRPQEREAPALAVRRVLARRERSRCGRSAAPLPDREADQLQAGEDAITEVQFDIGEFSGRVACVVRRDLDRQVCGGRVSRSHSVSIGTVMWWFLRSPRNPTGTGRERTRGE